MLLCFLMMGPQSHPNVRLANQSFFSGFLFALLTKGVGVGYGAFILLINS